jgi:hypothetical protein
LSEPNASASASRAIVFGESAVRSHKSRIEA